MTGHSKSSLMVGLLVGATAGATAALLLAPATGKRSRVLIRQQTGEIAGAVTNQLKSLWTNGNGATAEVNGNGGAESHGEAAVEPGPGETSHWCAEHRMAYTQKNGKAGETWWSHKAPDGSWCRE